MKLPLAAVASVLMFAPAHAATVIVTISGIEPGKGLVKVGVCNTALSPAGCPLGGENTALADTQKFIFENIPEGSYGFTGYQDINANEKFDKNFLGIPQEPYALSNGAGAKMIPTFKDTLTPVFDGQDNYVEIQLQRFGGSKDGKASTAAARERN